MATKIGLEERRKIYAAAAFLDSDFEKKTGVRIPFDVYFQDPFVAAEDEEMAFDDDFFVPWEPGLADGPTSARFAVVDYNGDTGQLFPPATWSDRKNTYLYKRKEVNRKQKDTMQFHQVHAWAIAQRALLFFEEGWGCGRRIPWGFDGNRLIIVPHAGQGKNAYYDRTSKSLQFYFFDRDGERIHTCLSTEIVNHEFGHAVLDGIRPLFRRSIQLETAAFHEFIGDISAILLSLRNNALRAKYAADTGGDLAKATSLSSIAEQFGRAARNRPYLRTANNTQTMSDIRHVKSVHRISEVMTGTMFEILTGLAAKYQERGRTPLQAFWDASSRMQRTVLQPLDLLPPVDVTFRDYALAVLRAERIANPLDPHDYHGKMLDVFIRREILSEADRAELQQPMYLYDRKNMDVFYDIETISNSRATAYRFLHDNRRSLKIPPFCDLKVVDLYDGHKLTRQGRRLPRQIILEYIWEEPVELTGSKFGQFSGKITTQLCGGTLVFDQNGTVLSWFEKKGADGSWEGNRRRAGFQENIVAQLAGGRVGFMADNPLGFIAKQMPPVVARERNGVVQFGITPHLHLSEDVEDEGGRSWEMSF